MSEATGSVNQIALILFTSAWLAAIPLCRANPQVQMWQCLRSGRMYSLVHHTAYEILSSHFQWSFPFFWRYGKITSSAVSLCSWLKQWNCSHQCFLTDLNSPNFMCNGFILISSYVLRIGVSEHCHKSQFSAPGKTLHLYVIGHVGHCQQCGWENDSDGVTSCRH